MPIVVKEVATPSVVGEKVYVNSHDAFDASSTPAQFWLPPKFVGSLGAPPAKLGVSGPAVRLVMTTGTVPVAPSTTLPKSRSSGATPKPVAVVVEPDDVPVDV